MRFIKPTRPPDSTHFSHPKPPPPPVRAQKVHRQKKDTAVKIIYDKNRILHQGKKCVLSNRLVRRIRRIFSHPKPPPPPVRAQKMHRQKKDTEVKIIYDRDRISASRKNTRFIGPTRPPESSTRFFLLRDPRRHLSALSTTSVLAKTSRIRSARRNRAQTATRRRRGSTVSLSLSTMWLARVIALTACLIAVRCVNITEDNYALAFDYLQKYGYLTKDVDAIPAQRRNDVLRRAIEDFQKYYDLPGDGTLDDKTLEMMGKSRCGFRDILRHGTRASLSKWPKTHLTWDFYLATESELNTARAAFDVWSQHSALTFERSGLNPDIVISWRRLHHGNMNVAMNGPNCTDKFDGPGGVLAHASLPMDEANFVSEVHVDGDEPWHIFVSRNPSDTMSLHYTLTHEIGHSLGLLHNKRRTSVMFAFTPDKQYPVKLDRYDIVDIQRLYGEKLANDPPQTPAPPPPPPSPDLCALDRVNAILIVENRMFISYRHYVWSFDLDGRTYNGPLALSNHMGFLHDNYTRVTAAYQSPSGDVVVFADNLVYLVQYPELTLRPDWPKTLQELGFPPKTKINGAVNTHRGRSFVLFNGNSVGEINECDHRVARFTPLEATFPGIPIGVTSIFRYIDGNLYFTTRTQYYRFNEFTRTVTAAGKFDLRILNIVCPKDDLLKQLRDLLDRFVRVSDLTSSTSDSNDDEDGVRLSDQRK